MRRSEENIREVKTSEEISQTSHRRRVLFLVITLLVIIVGFALTAPCHSHGKQIMAPGPLGSTNSIAQPLS